MSTSSTNSSSPPSQPASASSHPSSSSPQLGAVPVPESIKSKKTRLSASSVHEEFTNVVLLDPKSNQNISGKQCKHCSKQMMSSNPTNLKGHLRTNHKEVFLRVEGIFNCTFIIHASVSSLFIFSQRY